MKTTKNNTLKIDVELTPDKIVETLLKDVATVKEAFIIDELQKYMDLTQKPPVWVEPVRLRLQEKDDWKRQCEYAIEKCISRSNNEWTDTQVKEFLYKELELN